MRDLKPVTATNMLECLRPHKKFPQAAEIIRQRLPDCVKDGVSSEYKARSIFWTQEVNAHSLFYLIILMIPLLVVIAPACTVF